MSHCPQCNKLMRGICRYCQPQEYIDMMGRAFTELSNQQRQWVGLTDEEMRKLADKHLFYQPESYEVSGVFALSRAIEAKLKEKNS